MAGGNSGQPSQAPAFASRVSGRSLSDDARDPADRGRRADQFLVSTMVGQVDRQKRTRPRLDLGREQAMKCAYLDPNGSAECRGDARCGRNPAYRRATAFPICATFQATGD